MTVQSWIPSDSGIDLQDLPLWNMAISHMEAPIALGTEGLSLRLSAIAAPRLTGPLHSFKNEDGKRFYVHIDAFPYEKLLGIDFDLAKAGDLPPVLATSLLAGSAEFVLNALPREYVSDLRYCEVIGDAETEVLLERNDLKWFAAAIDGLAATVFVSIAATATDICGYLQGRLQHSRSVLTNLREMLRVSVHRFVGSATLAIADVQSLQIGDFVILEQAAPDDLALRCDDRIFHFETAEAGWLCTAIRSAQDLGCKPAMDEPFTDPLEPSETEPTEKTLPDMSALISTLVTFECGQAQMTLAELESLQTGAVVPLPDQLTKDGLQVIMRAGNQPVATGDILQIDDRIAVRINRLLVQSG
ncbi:MAG: FliM/FliN family flagellar motor switch protein [Pseudomonadota bacterium]